MSDHTLTVLGDVLGIFGLGASTVSIWHGVRSSRRTTKAIGVARAAVVVGNAALILVKPSLPETGDLRRAVDDTLEKLQRYEKEIKSILDDPGNRHGWSEDQEGTNWKRGFLRLWIAATLVWCGLVAWHGYSDLVVSRHITADWAACSEAHKTQSWLCDPIIDPIGPALRTYSLIAVLPPVALLLLWGVVAWIIAGFRTPKEAD
jgi:hypothetical protein